MFFRFLVHIKNSDLFNFFLLFYTLKFYNYCRLINDFRKIIFIYFSKFFFLIKNIIVIYIFYLFFHQYYTDISLLYFIPVFTIFLINCISNKYIWLIKIICLVSNLLLFWFSLSFLIPLNTFSINFLNIHLVSWFSFLNLDFKLGIDSISILFIILVIFLIFLCLVHGSFTIKTNICLYLSLFLFLEFLLLIIFSSLNIFIFFIFFESVLIPMFLIIGYWGSNKRKLRANYIFFIYTLFGSIFMFIGLLYLYKLVGTFDYQKLIILNFPFIIQQILWFLFFIAFAVKIPLIPIHIWLPEAHVEAPTGGSVILAGILIKLGAYGFLRFLLPLFPLASIYYTPFIYIIGVVGVVYTSLIAISQTDMKKSIAYASISHMSFTSIGLFSFTISGLIGSILQMISHGLVSSALFFCIGFLYDRYHTRDIEYFGGLVYILPLFSIFFFIFTLLNIAVPGTLNFNSELLLFLGIFQRNIFCTLLIALNLIFSAIYSLWLFDRMIFGNLNIHYNIYNVDLYRFEFIILLLLLIPSIFLGIYPKYIISLLEPSIKFLDLIILYKVNLKFK